MYRNLLSTYLNDIMPCSELLCTALCMTIMYGDTQSREQFLRCID